MKTPIPTSVLSCARYTVAAYEVSAFLSVPHDVGGRALPKPTRLHRRCWWILSVIIVAIIACAIAMLVIADASVDTIPMANSAVLIRYSGKIAFGAPQWRQDNNVAVESIIQHRMRILTSRINFGADHSVNARMFEFSPLLHRREPASKP